jgi:hypothetical protein
LASDGGFAGAVLDAGCPGERSRIVVHDALPMRPRSAVRPRIEVRLSAAIKRIGTDGKMRIAFVWLSHIAGLVG